jgi:hypothetical protein
MSVKIDGTLGINKVQDGTITSGSFADSVNLPGKPTAATASPGTKTVQLATTEFVAGEKGGRRNYLINGNFDKWDYGTSQTTSAYGSDNRWWNASNISTKTHSQVACGDTERTLFNAMYFSRTVSNYVAGTNSFAKKMQHIENINLLAGKTVTLSFWARADSNKKACITLSDFYGTGGTPSASGGSPILIGIVDLTTTWTRYSFTFTVHSIVGKSLGTDGPQTTSWRLDIGLTYSADRFEVTLFGMAVGQSGTLDLAQVKIEDGAVATNGWHPYDGEFGGETQACERYYETIYCANWGYASGAVTGAAGFLAKFNTNKRVIPTLSSFTAASSNGTNTYSMDSITLSMCRVVYNSTGSGIVGVTGNFTASAEMQ